MGKKQKTVTIGIPAYNEEKTIGVALDHIFDQSQSNYILEKVLVISDGSTDKTVSIIKRKYPAVTVVDSRNKKGKVSRVNQIVKNNSSDVLILVDADIKFASKDVVDRVVELFISNMNLGVSYAYHIAQMPDTFVGKLAYFGYAIWDKARTKLGERGIRYYAEGGFMAISKKFATDFAIPSELVGGDDSYSFYKAMELGFDVEVDKKAVVYIDLADTFSDYVRQMRRFLEDPTIVRNHFPKSLIDTYETMTSRLKFQVMIEEIVKNPVVGIAYVGLQSYTKLPRTITSEAAGWEPIARK